MSAEQRAAFLKKRRERFAKTGRDEQRDRREKNPGLTARYAKDWYSRNKERGQQNQREYRDRMKVEVFAHYGGICVCCGEPEIEFLSIDHIVPLLRSSKTRGGSALYQQIKNAGYPTGLQILCFNCNLAKRVNPECPHVRKYLKLVTEEPRIL